MRYLLLVTLCLQLFSFEAYAHPKKHTVFLDHQNYVIYIHKNDYDVIQKYVLSTELKTSCSFIQNSCPSEYNPLSKAGYQGIVSIHSFTSHGYVVLDMKRKELVLLPNAKKVKSNYVHLRFHAYHPKSKENEGEFEVVVTTEQDIEFPLKIQTLSPSFFTTDYEGQMRSLERDETFIGADGRVDRQAPSVVNIQLGNIDLMANQQNIRDKSFGLNMILHSVIAFPIRIDGPILIAHFKDY